MFVNKKITIKTIFYKNYLFLKYIVRWLYFGKVKNVWIFDKRVMRL